MSGGVPATSIFDPTKYYRSVLYVPGTMAMDFDWNHVQEILDYYLRKGITDLHKCSIVTVDLVGYPIKSVEESIDNLPTDGIFEIYFTTATKIKHRKNGGTWNDNGGTGYSVTTDGITVNENVGGSGLNIVFNKSQTTANTAEISLGFSVKTLGKDPKYLSAYKVSCFKSVLYFYGYRIVQDAVVKDIPSATSVNYLYYDVWTETIEYTSDYDFAHKMADDRYNEPSPDRQKVRFTLNAAALIPTAPSGHVYIPYARTEDNGSGVLTVTPLVRAFGDRIADEIVDSNPLTVPSHLRATSGSNEYFFCSQNAKAAAVIAGGVANNYVNIKWNDEGTGIGSTGQFVVTFSDITAGAPNYTVNEWVGFYLSVNDVDYKILSNTATTLTLEEDINPGSGAFVIHSGGTSYHVVFERHLYDSGGTPQDWIKATDDICGVCMSPPNQSKIFTGITPGERVRFKIASIGNTFRETSGYSDWLYVDVTSYTRHNVADEIDLITIMPKDTGFDITARIKTAKRTEIQAVEYAWSDDNTTPVYGSKNSAVVPIFPGSDMVIHSVVGDICSLGVPYKAIARCVDTIGRYSFDSMSVEGSKKSNALTGIIAKASGTQVEKPIMYLDSEVQFESGEDWKQVTEPLRRYRPEFLTKLRIQCHFFPVETGIAQVRCAIRIGGETKYSDVLESTDTDPDQDVQSKIFNVACADAGMSEIWLEAKGVDAATPVTFMVSVDFAEIVMANY